MENCSQCNKPQKYCKGLCQACYSKMQRNTEYGKKRMQEYNLTRGKDAQRRWREKVKLSKPPKPPKPPKENCECGRTSIVKGLCTRCYQRIYSRKRFGFNPRNKKVHDATIIFNKVLSKVKNGLTIREACKASGIASKTFYNIIDPIQKSELRFQKIVGPENDYDEYDNF